MKNTNKKLKIKVTKLESNYIEFDLINRYTGDDEIKLEAQSKLIDALLMLESGKRVHVNVLTGDKGGAKLY